MSVLRTYLHSDVERFESCFPTHSSASPTQPNDRSVQLAWSSDFTSCRPVFLVSRGSIAFHDQGPDVESVATEDLNRFSGWSEPQFAVPFHARNRMSLEGAAAKRLENSAQSHIPVADALIATDSRTPIAKIDTSQFVEVAGQSIGKREFAAGQHFADVRRQQQIRIVLQPLAESFELGHGCHRVTATWMEGQADALPRGLVAECSKLGRQSCQHLFVVRLARGSWLDAGPPASALDDGQEPVDPTGEPGGSR